MKMKTYAKYVMFAGISILALFLFYLSASAWGALISTKDNVLFYLKQPISIRDAQEADRQNQEKKRESSEQESEAEAMPEFCIWGQKDEVTLTNENLFRSTQADAILLCGNPELLFEDCRLPGRKDSEGCLVDEETAWELFGSVDVVDKEISYEGKAYTIRKVIPGKEKIFAFQVSSQSQGEASGGAQAEKGLSGGSQSESGLPDGGQAGQSEEGGFLNRITVQRPEGKSLRDLELAWSRYGISVTILDLELLRGIGGFCVLLVPVTSCIYFLCCLFRQYKEEKKLIWKGAAAACGLLLAVSFSILLKSRIQIPDDYIPTRWSDFSFWEELWSRKQEAVRLLLQIPQTDLDYGWIEAFSRTAGFGIFAEALAVLLISSWRRLHSF